MNTIKLFIIKLITEIVNLVSRETDDAIKYYWEIFIIRIAYQ